MKAVIKQYKKLEFSSSDVDARKLQGETDVRRNESLVSELLNQLSALNITWLQCSV